MPTEPASLVNEAYIRLRKIQNMQWNDRHHFFSVAAVELRRILVDQARLRVAQKREGSQRRIPMSDDLSWVDVRSQDMLDLDRALTDLEKLDADKVRLVELRYLMGCTVPEICELRGVSDATIKGICVLRAPGCTTGFIRVRREPRCPSAGRSSVNHAAFLHPLAISEIQRDRVYPHPKG
jgi:ECF sigma factor